MGRGKYWCLMRGRKEDLGDCRAQIGRRGEIGPSGGGAGWHCLGVPGGDWKQEDQEAP